MTDKTNASQRAHRIHVWDRVVRLFHWGLFAAVVTAGITGFWLGAPWIVVHVIAGLLAGGLVLTRIVWGFTGSRYARFAEFVRSPRAVLAHLGELRSGAAPRHIGHNPLGALMVLALIGVILLLVFTGLLVLGGELKTLPLGPLPYELGRLAHAGHKLLAWGLVAMIVLHVLGALFESRRTDENLPVAMITGHKERRLGDAPSHLSANIQAKPAPALMTAGLLIAVLAGWLGGPGIGTHARLTAHAPVPPAAFNADYASECSDCHAAYHPSLLPAASWRQLLAHLDNHFGEDASLDPETVKAIGDWLTTVSADRTDSKPAHVFRRVDSAHAFSISQTPFWKRTHAAIPREILNSPPVYGAFNCSACHHDAASGWFFPANISLPTPTPTALTPTTTTETNTKGPDQDPAAKE